MTEEVLNKEVKRKRHNEDAELFKRAFNDGVQAERERWLNKDPDVKGRSKI